MGHVQSISVRQVPQHPTIGGRYLPPLLKRAWVYQERLLSPRVIHFTNSETQFECQTSCECECGGYILSRRPRSAKHTFANADGEIKMTPIPDRLD